ncbi:MAG: hypothetical protein A2288_03690 [Candidatus Moranbacteria bacterium RIFOXYA12_FULL_44_15]|nr:MAG: hypothetical protein A2288_03690 [Candidatus Moranbacteria bacterium RIFOXYA12_FULL_44_15]OGI34674.1 MAG: hypothetical protein A2259_04860 [Candidatus Moranbacteria bacterium RIFOXYA2_FULL_43_15]
MEFLENILPAIPDFVREIYYSTPFTVIKFLLGIYSVVLFVNIVMLLFQRGLAGDVRDTILGMNVPPELTTKKSKLKKRWEKIRAKVESGNESDWKVAVIEADNIIDDLIKRMGYAGENMAERLDAINPGQIENIEELWRAHQTRNRIIHEDDFKLDKASALDILGDYEEFLKEFEVLE